MDGIVEGARILDEVITGICSSLFTALLIVYRTVSYDLIPYLCHSASVAQKILWV